MTDEKCFEFGRAGNFRELPQMPARRVPRDELEINAPRWRADWWPQDRGYMASGTDLKSPEHKVEDIWNPELQRQESRNPQNKSARKIKKN